MFHTSISPGIHSCFCINDVLSTHFYFLSNTIDEDNFWSIDTGCHVPVTFMFSLMFLAWKVLARMLHTQWENSSSLKNFVILLKFQIFVYVIGQNLVNPMSFRSMPKPVSEFKSESFLWIWVFYEFCNARKLKRFESEIGL